GSVRHDAMRLEEDMIADFEDDTDYTVELSAPGDGGELVNQLILTKDSPLGDVAYGVDNSFAGRGIAEGVFEPYTSADLPAGAEQYLADDAGSLTPIDMGDVCLNVDHEWFTEHDVAEPETLDGVLEGEYQDLVLVTNPATSAPGL